MTRTKLPGRYCKPHPRGQHKPPKTEVSHTAAAADVITRYSEHTIDHPRHRNNSLSAPPDSSCDAGRGGKTGWFYRPCAA